MLCSLCEKHLCPKDQRTAGTVSSGGLNEQLKGSSVYPFGHNWNAGKEQSFRNRMLSVVHDMSLHY
jgi:hypothetical protein